MKISLLISCYFIVCNENIVHGSTLSWKPKSDTKFVLESVLRFEDRFTNEEEKALNALNVYKSNATSYMNNLKSQILTTFNAEIELFAQRENEIIFTLEGQIVTEEHLKCFRELQTLLYKIEDEKGTAFSNCTLTVMSALTKKQKSVLKWIVEREEEVSDYNVLSSFKNENILNVNNKIWDKAADIYFEFALWIRSMKYDLNKLDKLLEDMLSEYQTCLEMVTENIFSTLNYIEGAAKSKCAANR